MDDDIPHPDEIPNEERGCGFLEPGACYLRTDPEAVSRLGTLPFFVSCDPPIAYKESHFRGYREFPGLAWEMATSGKATDYRPLGRPGEWESPAEYETELSANMALACGGDPGDRAYSSEVRRHMERLADDPLDGSHAGEVTQFRAPDLLMHVGKTHYETPTDFVRECREQGLNKRVPLGSRSKPPVVNPARTRLWVIHPNAIPKRETEDNDEFYAGIIGYVYLTRAVYTRPEDDQIPQYVQEYAASDYLDIVDIGPRVPYESDNHSLQEYVLDEDDSEGPDSADTADQPDTAQDTASEADGGDGADCSDAGKPDEGDDPSPEQESSEEVETVAANEALSEAETRTRLVDLSETSFNGLRTIVSEKCDASLQNPTVGDLVETLIAEGWRIADGDDETMRFVKVDADD